MATGPFRKPRKPTKFRSKQNQPYRSKNRSQFYMSNTRKDFPKRSSNVRPFPSSKPASFSTKFWKPTFPLPILPHPDILMEGRLVHFVEKWGGLTQNKWDLYSPRMSQDPIQFDSPSVHSSDKSEPAFLPVITRRNKELHQKRTVERVPCPGTLVFFFPGAGCSFTRTEKMSCVYHGRTKGEGCVHVKSI